MFEIMRVEGGGQVVLLVSTVESHSNIYIWRTLQKLVQEQHSVWSGAVSVARGVEILLFAENKEKASGWAATSH